MDGDDKVLGLLCKAFTNRQLFKGQLLDSPMSSSDYERLIQYYVAELGVTDEEASYFFVEHISTSNTYSEKGEAIDILYKDNTVRDIAEASDMLNMENLTFKPQKRYLFRMVL